MRKIRYIAIAAAVAVCASAVHAQNLDIIKNRRETMRAISEQSLQAFKMNKGEQPFDLEKVQAGIKIMNENLAKFGAMFPENAKEGGGTDAQPKVWADRAGFESAIEKTKADLAIAASAIKDEASFKEQASKITGNCNLCHKAADGYTIRLGDSFKKPLP